jgi:uncharacterized protein DUF6706
MTNKEALIAKLNYPLSDNALEVAMIDRGIQGGQVYTPDGKKDIELATMDLLYLTLTQPDVVEGGYQVLHQDFLKKVRERLMQLATLNGATDIIDLLNPPIAGADNSGVQDVSYLW